jgi:hypothetical protein
MWRPEPPSKIRPQQAHCPRLDKCVSLCARRSGEAVTEIWDAVVVVGAGHNGLTAAAYLGKAGLRTLWRRRDITS